MSCSKALPYILRVTASGALLTGSLINMLNGEKPNPFFYCSLYSSAIYTISNLVEAYEAVKPIRVPLADLEEIRVESFSQRITKQTFSRS